MVIVLVLDQYDKEDNGLTVSAARFAEKLRARGHEVRICATGKPAPGKYVMKTKIYPIIDPIISAQGTVFARSDDDLVRQALTGADIVHLYLPFRCCMRVREIAEEMGIPYMAAFHTQPENITYNCGMKYFTPLAHWLYWWFNRRFYQYVDDIHCPTSFIAGQLKKHHYTARLHVISNGADESFRPLSIEKPPEWRDRFIIMMIGRLSEEKRQDLIIKAAIHSKYSDQIQLVFPGKGPRQHYYEHIAQKLKNPPVFCYYKRDDLIRLMNQCDLYVHAAEVEIEAISCIEAFSCGLVPVIADARMSATRQFALDQRCLFKDRSVNDLVKKIEYWIEHPVEKAEMSRKYIEYSAQYRVSLSVDRMEKIYHDVIARFRGHQAAEGNLDVEEMMEASSALL
jgi:1,2-diacylglycerol 3-alpha-glucosyltransferase